VIPDFRDVLVELLESGARFLVVGAHALSTYGVPRATVDLDLWVEATPDNARRVYDALARFGAPMDDLGVRLADLHTPDAVLQFGLPPYRVDILTSISGVEFDTAWSKRVEHEIEGVRVPVIGRDEFIQNKRASGRKKDLADLESLGVD
jgi:predicted nucleotidyltransferase